VVEGRRGNPVGMLTIVRRELVRTYKVVNQVIWPPIITMILYVVVLGVGLGGRIRDIDGVPYSAFLIPGLIMLQVVSATYDETASSLFQGRFLNSIQELLIAPLSAVEIVTGFMVAAVVRAFGIALLMQAVGYALTRALPQDWPLYFAVIFLVAVTFGALGLIMGQLAEKFEHVAIPTTFIITPLLFTGGVFTSRHFLPPILQRASLFNPMVYMVEAFRYSFIQRSDVPAATAFGVVAGIAAVMLAAAVALARSGCKLRT
jgi:ABC-2 type transport system permease protein